MLHLTKVLLLFAVSTAAAPNFDHLVKKVSESKNPAKTDSTTTTKCSHSCPFGWVKFDGRCYSYQARRTDWFSAESHCVSLYANLVSIHNENEYQLVKALIRANDPQENPTWIGLSGCQKKNSWVWSDGTKVTYTKWNSNEPSFTNNECCVNINWPDMKYYAFNWNDAACEWNYNFVCVKRIIPYIYTS